MQAMPVKTVSVSLQPVAQSSEYMATVKSRRSATILPQVAGIEVDPLDGRITVFPKPGERILEPVEALLRQQGLEISEIQLERGRIDEVFRQITLGGEREAQP